MSRAFFNEKASEWDKLAVHDNGKITTMLDMVGITLDSRVLDVGCGTGVLIPHVWSRCSSLCCVDFAENMIAEAKKKFRANNISFICADVLAEEFTQDRFDVILCYSVFPHFPDPQEAINKLSGYLKPRGKLAVMHSQSREAINAMHKQPEDPRSMGYLPDLGEMGALMQAANMELVMQKDFDGMYLAVGLTPVPAV